MDNKTTLTVEENKLIITRVFSAPKERVWDAWANPDIFAAWWGPNGWQTTVAHHEFSAGGYLLYGMRCEDESQGEWYGQESWGKMEFSELVPKDSFNYTDFFTDNQGTATPGMPSVRTENTLETVDGGTRFTSIGYYDKSEDLKTVMEMGMEEGIKQTWDRLEQLLGSEG